MYFSLLSPLNSPHRRIVPESFDKTYIWPVSWFQLLFTIQPTQIYSGVSRDGCGETALQYVEIEHTFQHNNFRVYRPAAKTHATIIRALDRVATAFHMANSLYGWCKMQEDTGHTQLYNWYLHPRFRMQWDCSIVTQSMVDTPHSTVLLTEKSRRKKLRNTLS